jgi:hypothetical protein
MLWQRATQPQTSRSAGPVPEGESVRLAALQAAWKRDRWIARRRIGLRWTLWGAQRYGVPAAGFLGVSAALWFAVHATMGWLETPSPTEPVVASAQPIQPKVGPTSAPAPKPSAAITPAELAPITFSDASATLLKFEPSLRASVRSETPVSFAALPDAAKIPNPQLISENWLHSKEP